MKRTIQVLRPDYVKRFSCSGGACEDTCCKKWSISIDKKTYMRYRQIKDPDISKLIQTSIKRAHGPGASDAIYAHLVMNEKGMCSFLNDKGLCSLQKKYGEKYLCDTCRFFPRGVHYIADGVYEEYMSASCPEVIRAAMLNKGPIAFDMSDEVIEFEGSNFSRIKTPLTKRPGEYKPEHILQLRKSCIDILQCRKIPLRKRIILIGMMLKRINEEQDKGKISSLCGAYISIAREGDVPDIFEDKTDNASVRAEMSAVLIGYILENSGLAAKLQRSERSRVFSSDEILSFSKYADSCAEKHWAGFLEQNEAVLENFFVNYVFGSIFPFSFAALNLYQHFIALVEMYSLLRMLICAGLEEVKGNSDTIVISVIKDISVMTQHSDFAYRIITDYVNKGYDTLPHMLFLLSS